MSAASKRPPEVSRYRSVAFLQLDVTRRPESHDDDDLDEMESLAGSVASIESNTCSPSTSSSPVPAKEAQDIGNDETPQEPSRTPDPSPLRQQLREPSSAQGDSSRLKTGENLPPIDVTDLLAALQRAQSRARSAEDALSHVDGLLQRMASESAEAESAANDSLAQVAVMLRRSRYSAAAKGPESPGSGGSLPLLTAEESKKVQARHMLYALGSDEGSRSPRVAEVLAASPQPMYQSKLLHPSAMADWSGEGSVRSVPPERRRVREWVWSLRQKKESASRKRHIAQGLRSELWRKCAAPEIGLFSMWEAPSTLEPVSPVLASSGPWSGSRCTADEEVTEVESCRSETVEAGEADATTGWGVGNGGRERERLLERSLWRTTMELRRCERELAVYKQQKLLAERKTSFLPSTGMKKTSRRFSPEIKLRKKPAVSARSSHPVTLDPAGSQAERQVCMSRSASVCPPSRGSLLLLLLCSVRDFLSWALSDQEMEGSPFNGSSKEQCHVSIIVELVLAAHVA